MVETYNPDEINKYDKEQKNVSPSQEVSPEQTSRREAQPLSQDDAIILKDTKDEFDRTPLPIALYDAVIDQANFGFSKDGKPKINFTFRITGPSQIGRLVWLNLVPRGSHPFGSIMLKRLLARAQKPDAKGQYHSLIESVDTEKKFIEKDFCDSALAIGAECRINVGIGRPYPKKNPDGTITTVTPNNIKDILYPDTGQEFLKK